jgi:hypothetical protein
MSGAFSTGPDPPSAVCTADPPASDRACRHFSGTPSAHRTIRYRRPHGAATGGGRHAERRIEVRHKLEILLRSVTGYRRMTDVSDLGTYACGLSMSAG